MGRSLALPLILLASGAVACASAGYALWRQAFPVALRPPLAVVSGSSLVETLHGETVRGTCRDCGGPLRFATESVPGVGDVLCPHCGETIDVGRLSPAPADRVAVRPLAEGETPRIGGLYVFAAPEGGDAAPVVKRVVAGPGQRASIAGGDLFLDGDRLRKDPRSLERPVVVVHEARPAGDLPVNDSPWKRESRPGDSVALEFRPRAVWSVERSPTPVLDAYPSQAVERRRLNPVLDVWAVGELAGDPLDAEFVYRAEPLAWSLRVEADGAWSFSRGEQILVQGTLSDWSERESFRFGMLDRQLFLVRPERESIVVPLEDGPDDDGPIAASLSPLAIVVPKSVSIDDLRIERDVHYLPPIGEAEPWEEPPARANDGWFALGDYPSYSTDSRHFGRFAREAVLGEALLPPIAVEERHGRPDR